jgi:hypothetical protein
MPGAGAVAALVALGPPVVPLLRQALPGAELEQARRIQICLDRIATVTEQQTLPHVAAGLLALRRPPGASEALLDYVPFTEDAVMQWEVTKALKLLSDRDARPDPVPRSCWLAQARAKHERPSASCSPTPT